MLARDPETQLGDHQPLIGSARVDVAREVTAPRQRRSQAAALGPLDDFAMATTAAATSGCEGRCSPGPMATRSPCGQHGRMSVLVWSMVGIAVWHFTIFLPDRFAGGIIGAFLAAWLGAILSGFMVEGLSIPTLNPPGLEQALWALPGSILGLVAGWVVGMRSERAATT